MSWFGPPKRPGDRPSSSTDGSEEAPTPDPYATSASGIADPYARDDAFAAAEPTWPTLPEAADDAVSSSGGAPPYRSSSSPPPSGFSSPGQQKSGQRADLSVIAVKCGATAVLNGINGAVVGAVVGGAIGVMEARQLGTSLDRGTRARHVGFRVGATASQFGGFLGGYTGLRCACKGVRGKDDALNSGIAAGVVSALPALRTGSPGLVLTTALSSGAFMVFAETVMGGSHSSSSATTSANSSADPNARGAPSQ
mmetsp:Transcript_12547/g.50433  ORF Transcript_12547/g.50433 Transcript_12547/m.50433 type:complete len:253 (+) Transcript_12547:71-829(+)